jgi:SPASM domain peptide maturase of grasp-with-spasm system
MNYKYFYLFSDCKLVKGFKRSLICDLNRNSVQAIPNDLFSLFIESNFIDLQNINKKLNNEDRKIVFEYFEFLVEEEFGYYSNINNVNLFSKFNTKNITPHKITNIIIDFKRIDFFEINKFITEIIYLNIYNLELRFFVKKFSLNNLYKLHQIIDKTSLKHVSLILPFSNFKNNNIEEYSLFRFNQIIFYNSEIDNYVEHPKTNFHFTKQSILPKSCGIINEKYFSINIPSFTESLNHNSCLHKKISIDVNGNIKNCPSMPQSFGNIKDTTLEQALEHPDFKKYWNITKDQIEVCKDCEFRHICTDCRAYTEDPENMLSKPLKCGYNPYTNEWAEWSTNPLKQKAIEYYGMQELVKKDV